MTAPAPTLPLENNPLPASANLLKPTHLIAVGFGSGLMPKAPGTWGSLAAIPIAYLMLLLPAYAQFCVVLFGCLGGIWLCGRVAQDLGVHDHPSIVWDEFCGIWISLILCPIEYFWWGAPVAFALFRYFDIKKPGWIGWLDQTQKGGWGIMADDILAGLMTLTIMQALILVFH